MSADNDEPPADGGLPTTAAADVSFVKLNSEHHAEPSSQAEPTKSSEKRKSSTSDKLARYRSKRSSAVESPTSPHTSRLPRKTGGFLLDAVFTNGKGNEDSPSQRHGKAAAPNGHVQSHQRKSRVSEDSSRRGSPLSRQVSAGEDAKPNTARPAGSRSPNVDPSQLVQMALNLSESRKRNVSSSLPVPISPAGSRRVVSALDSGYGTVKSTSSSAKRASYLSNGHYDSSPGSTKMSEPEMDDDHSFRNGDNILYTFSPATLSRAERSRKYFELANEHRRLLRHLPPLKPDATAPGNFTTQATSSPGSAHYHVDRFASNVQSKHQLGRAYNPLQALRNRRLRNRERRPLTAPPDTWQDTDRVRQWIDGVEVAAKNPPFFRPGEDQVRLPTFHGEFEADVDQPEVAKRHRRSDTASSVITRPENGWSIEPAELLADTYWMEKNANKAIVEDRHGKRIFPSRVRASLEVPRQSKESEHGDDENYDKRSQPNDSDHDDRVRHRRRNMLPIPARLRRNRANRSGSTSSASSDEGRKPPPLQFGNSDGGDENIGPLERHMRQMIAKDENGELSSPELVSPDHWDSKYTQFSSVRSSFEGHRPEPRATTAQGELSVDTGSHQRSRSADGRIDSVDRGMASVDEVLSDSPASPVNSRHATPVAAAGQSSKRASPLEHTTMRSHIPILRNRSKERNNTDTTDFATGDRNAFAPILSASTGSGQPRSSLDSSRPSPVKRHRTTESTSSSLYRVPTAATSTETSAKDSVGRRFLKGGRIGELVRNEGSRLGDRFRSGRDKVADPGSTNNVSRPQSDASDTDDGNLRRTDGRPVDSGDADSQVSPRGSFDQERQRTRYFNPNLPSFKSPSGRNRRSTAETPMSEQSDPFDRQSKLGGELEASRFSRLPKINLPDDDTVSDPDMSRKDIKKYPVFDFGYNRRMSASQNNLSRMPTNVTVSRPKRQDGFPVTGLSVHEARRHWSISDQAQSLQVDKVTVRDVARVRALLLASGIKAHEICLKAETPRDATAPLLSKVAATTGQPIDRVARKDEDVVAARLLSDNLSKTMTEFERLLRRFRGETAKSLHTQLDNLAHRASEQLTNIVDETSDEADAFNVELTTRQPQEVKRVDDAIDAIIRQRRRRFRMVRRAGFKMLEWLVLGIMWWVWFLVVLFNIAKKSLVGVVRALRWLLWF